MTVRFAILTMLSVLLLMGAGASAKPGNAKNGKVLYQKLECGTCHGSTGKGDGPLAKSLTPRPTNFADAKLMSKPTDAQLFKAIKSGGPAVRKSAAMPSYAGRATDSQIADVVAYLRIIAKPSGVKVAASIPAQGKALYQKQGCATCHGATGKGDGPVAKSLTPRPTNFADVKSMSRRTDVQLFKAIKSGGPAAGKSAAMPGYASSMTDAQIKAVVVYLRSWSR